MPLLGCHWHSDTHHLKAVLSLGHVTMTAEENCVVEHFSQQQLCYTPHFPNIAMWLRHLLRGIHAASLQHLVDLLPETLCVGMAPN